MPSLNNCPDYVGEGETIRCICLPSSASQSTSWPNHSNTSTLYVASVDRTMNGTQYVCRQVTAGGTAAGEVRYTVRVAYPPPLAPNISAVIVSTETTRAVDGENETLKLSPDSVVKCEVRGGRPLVSNIVFTCDSPHHPDMPDEVGQGLVASYVTLTDDGGIVTCTCSANWTPKPEVYLHYSNASFEIKTSMTVVGGQQRGTANVTQSSSPFTVDGISSVVLTCLPAFPVYSGTVYLWTVAPNSRIDCVESQNVSRNTCTYKPQVPDVGKTVTCIAVNPVTRTVDRGEIQPRFLLPDRSNATGNVTLSPSRINDKTVLIIAVSASGFVALVIAGTVVILCIQRNRNGSKGKDSCVAEDSKGIDMSLTSKYCNARSLNLKDRKETSECDTDALNKTAGYLPHGKQDTLPNGSMGKRSRQATLPTTEGSFFACRSPRPLTYANVSPHPNSPKMSAKSKTGVTTSPVALEEGGDSDTPSDITQVKGSSLKALRMVCGEDIDDLSIVSGEDYCNLVPPSARHDDIRHYSELHADHSYNQQSVCIQ